nr:transglycosylase domain-containing protein [Sphingomonas psychrotolerans]
MKRTLAAERMTQRNGSKPGLALKVAGAVLLGTLMAVIAYAALGYFDALRDSAGLKQRADALIAAGRGPKDLTEPKLADLLRIEDPAFWQHGGVDVQTRGAGLTTLTQSLSKRLAFKRFKPGLAKIRQTTYAWGLEARLSKPEILALFLDTAQLGRGPNGWMQGMFATSAQLYGKQPAELTDRQWRRLVAVLIAPREFNLLTSDKRLDERVRRIERVLDGKCRPRGERDVWLNGCA